MARLEIIKHCVNQDTGRLMKPGDIVSDLSAFEIGRHLAEGSAVPFVEKEIERAVAAPPEKRKRKYTRRKKNGTDG